MTNTNIRSAYSTALLLWMLGFGTSSMADSIDPATSDDPRAVGAKFVLMLGAGVIHAAAIAATGFAMFSGTKIVNVAVEAAKPEAQSSSDETAK